MVKPIRLEEENTLKHIHNQTAWCALHDSTNPLPSLIASIEAYYNNHICRIKTPIPRVLTAVCVVVLEVTIAVADRRMVAILRHVESEILIEARGVAVDAGEAVLAADRGTAIGHQWLTAEQAQSTSTWFDKLGTRQLRQITPRGGLKGKCSKRTAIVAVRRERISLCNRTKSSL